MSAEYCVKHACLSKCLSVRLRMDICRTTWPIFAKCFSCMSLVTVIQSSTFGVVITKIYSVRYIIQSMFASPSPPVSASTHSYSLRTRAHNGQLPDRLSLLVDCNFIIRMLFLSVILTFMSFYIQFLLFNDSVFCVLLSVYHFVSYVVIAVCQLLVELTVHSIVRSWTPSPFRTDSMVSCPAPFLLSISVCFLVFFILLVLVFGTVR